ncbi:hypothetical protein Esti_006120 [Eimeria stiedai]
MRLLMNGRPLEGSRRRVVPTRARELRAEGSALGARHGVSCTGVTAPGSPRSGLWELVPLNLGTGLKVQFRTMTVLGVGVQVEPLLLCVRAGPFGEWRGRPRRDFPSLYFSYENGRRSSRTRCPGPRHRAHGPSIAPHALVPAALLPPSLRPFSFAALHIPSPGADAPQTFRQAHIPKRVQTPSTSRNSGTNVTPFEQKKQFFKTAKTAPPSSLLSRPDSLNGPQHDRCATYQAQPAPNDHPGLTLSTAHSNPPSKQPIKKDVKSPELTEEGNHS